MNLNISLDNKKDILKEYIDNAKSTLRLLITKKCNSKCIYCYEEGIKNSTNNMEQNLDLEDFKNIILTGKKLGIKRVSISGGEPTLYFDWVEELVRLCHKNKLLVYLTTNATNPKIINLAKKYPKLEFRISLDCSSKEEYIKLRGIDSFEKSINIVKKLSKLKNEIHINRVILTLDKEWEKFNKLINLIKKLNLNQNNLYLRLIPCYPNKIAPSMEVKDYLNYLSKKLPELKTKFHNKNLQFMYEFNYKGVNIIIRTRGIFSPKCCIINKNKCVEGISYIRINPDGSIQPCFNSFLGKINHKDTIKIIKNKLLKTRKFLDKLYVKKYNKNIIKELK